MAGRVLVRTAAGVEPRLVNVDRDLLVIPSVAIHMDRTVNKGAALDPAVDLRLCWAWKTRAPSGA